MPWDARYRRRPAPKSEIFSPRPLQGKKHPHWRRKRKFATIAGTRSIPDILAIGDKGLSRWNAPNSSPLGKKLTSRNSAGVESGASGWLMRLGTAVFWTLAGTIVVARAIYFDPGIFDGFARAVAFLHIVPKG